MKEYREIKKNKYVITQYVQCYIYIVGPKLQYIRVPIPTYRWKNPTNKRNQNFREGCVVDNAKNS